MPISPNIKSFLASEYRRLGSRKYQVWLVASGIYIGALGVYLRTMTRCVWKYYDVLLNMKEGAAIPVEATGSVQIFSSFMSTLSWGYLFICVLYCATNLVDKYLGVKNPLPPTGPMNEGEGQ